MLRLHPGNPRLPTYPILGIKPFVVLKRIWLDFQGMNDPLKEFVVWEILYGIWMNVVGPRIQFDFVVEKVSGVNLVKVHQGFCLNLWLYLDWVSMLPTYPWGGINPDVVPWFDYSIWICGCIYIEVLNCLRILEGIKPDVVPKMIWLIQFY